MFSFYILSFSLHLFSQSSRFCIHLLLAPYETSSFRPEAYNSCLMQLLQTAVTLRRVALQKASQTKGLRSVNYMYFFSCAQNE